MMGLKDRLKGLAGKARGKYSDVQRFREEREEQRHQANLKKLEHLKAKEKRLDTELKIKRKEEKMRTMKGSMSPLGSFGSGKGLEAARGGGPGPNDPFAGFFAEPKKTKKRKKQKSKGKRVVIDIK